MTYQSTVFLANNLGRQFTSHQYLSLISSPFFEELIKTDLASIQTWAAANTFFQEHAQFIQPVIFTGHQTLGIDLWLNLLERLAQIDSTNFNRIHKGTPYYHTGILNLLAGRFIEAFEWLDYAFEQDTKLGLTETPDIWLLSFDTREGENEKGNDYGQTKRLLCEIEKILEKIRLYDSTFKITADSLRGVIKSKILTSSSSRSVKAAWATTLAIVLSQKNIISYLRVSPNSNEVQLTVHNTLLQLTLIIETLIKQARIASQKGVKDDDQIGDLFKKVIIQVYPILKLDNSGRSFRTKPISGNFSTIFSEILNAENGGDDKLAVSFNVAQRVRNNAHHMFSEEYVSEETFTGITTRLYYVIFFILDSLYK